MSAVHLSRIALTVALVSIPFAAAAQDTTATGSTLSDRLYDLVNGIQTVDALTPTPAAQRAWATEVERYRERRTELRIQCHDDIRRANRDTLTKRSGQCLRSDLLLEINHRRKQHETLMTIGFIPEIDTFLAPIDRWIDAAEAVVDGIDTGVFPTVDSLIKAKKNLHTTYRVPMLEALSRIRQVQALSALSVYATAFIGASDAVLSAALPCLEDAHASLLEGVLREGVATLRTCMAEMTDTLAEGE